MIWHAHSKKALGTHAWISNHRFEHITCSLVWRTLCSCIWKWLNVGLYEHKHYHFCACIAVIKWAQTFNKEPTRASSSSPATCTVCVCVCVSMHTRIHVCKWIEYTTVCSKCHFNMECEKEKERGRESMALWWQRVKHSHHLELFDLPCRVLQPKVPIVVMLLFKSKQFLLQSVCMYAYGCACMHKYIIHARHANME